jgi:type VI secretion system protein ImpK
MAGVAQEPLLVSRFREFYRHVLRLREAVEGAGRASSIEETARSLSETPSGSPHETLGGESPEDTAEHLVEPRRTGSAVDVDSVRLELLAVLESQSRDSGEGGGGAYPQVIDEARYAMAALADEVFLNADWEGRRPWKGHLLEAHLYESRRAGEAIFERIDELLDHPDPARNDLAYIYLMLLGLGFQGKYRDHPNGASVLAAYGRRLFVFLAQREPELQETTHHLFPEAYERFPGGRTGVRLPHLRPWILAFLLLLVIWLLVAHGVWQGLTAELEGLVQGAPTEVQNPTGTGPEGGG